MRKLPRITQHAYDQYVYRAGLLGQIPSRKALEATMIKAIPERRSTYVVTNISLCKRDLKYGDSRYFVHKGWRFIVQNGDLKTVERVKSYENYDFADRFQRGAQRQASARKIAA